jgi:hypothetical protein
VAFGASGATLPLEAGTHELTVQVRVTFDIGAAPGSS